MQITVAVNLLSPTFGSVGTSTSDTFAGLLIAAFRNRRGIEDQLISLGARPSVKSGALGQLRKWHAPLGVRQSAKLPLLYVTGSEQHGAVDGRGGAFRTATWPICQWSPWERRRCSRRASAQLSETPSACCSPIQQTQLASCTSLGASCPESLT